MERSPDLSILASARARGSRGADVSYFTGRPEVVVGFFCPKFFFLLVVEVAVEVRDKGPEPAVTEEEGTGRLRV